jgi:hypothetical protein
MTPTRTLQNVDLFNEILLNTNVYFATDKDGCGRVFDDRFFLGLAIPKTLINPTEYTVKLYGSLCPHENFRRRTYRSQKAANAALIRYARKALQLVCNVATTSK